MPLMTFVPFPFGAASVLPGTPSECWFLQALIGGYTGALVRVRRSSDNTEQDIGQGSGGLLDTSGLLSFCGAGSGFVRTLYGQVGVDDLEQATTTAQPMIVNSGSLVTLGGEPAMDFDGTDDFLASSAAISSFLAAAESVVAGVLHVDAIDTNSANAYNNDAFWADSGSFIGVHLDSTGPVIAAYNWDGNEDKAQTTIATATDFVHVWQHLPSGGARLESWVNGSHPSPSTSGSTTDLTGTLRLGRNYLSAYLNGRVAGLVTYATNLSTGDIGALGSALAAIYGITWT